MKVITTGLLNRFWTKGIKPWLDKRIKSYADLMVTTASGYTPDALAVKEGFTELNSKLNNESFSLQSGTSAITPAGTIASYDKASQKVFIAFAVLGSRKADEVIYVVPEKYRPSAHVQGVCILKTSTGDMTIGACSIKPNGHCVHNVTNADTNCVMCLFNYGI